MSNEQPATRGLAKAYIRMADELERQKTEWTTTPPSEPGWYWVTDKSGDRAITWFSSADTEVLAYVGNQKAGLVSLDYFTHWLGPLTMPEPPKD